MGTFNEKLKVYREKKNKTQQEVANLLGVTVKQIQRYENNIIPRPDKIKVLNRYFNHDFFDDIKSPDMDEDYGHEKDYKLKYIEALEENKSLVKKIHETEARCRYLEEHVKTNLDLSISNQQIMMRQLAVASRLIAESANSDPVRLQEVLNKIDKLVASVPV